MKTDPIALTLRVAAITIAALGFVATVACGVIGEIPGYAAITYAMCFVFCGSVAVLLD